MPAAAAVLTSLLAPAAHAATVSSLSVYSDADDLIGDGVPRVAYPGGPAVSARPDTFSGAGLALGAVTGEEGVGVELAPPPGEALRHNWTIPAVGLAGARRGGRQPRVQSGDG